MLRLNNIKFYVDFMIGNVTRTFWTENFGSYLEIKNIGIMVIFEIGFIKCYFRLLTLSFMLFQLLITTFLSLWSKCWSYVNKIIWNSCFFADLLKYWIKFRNIWMLLLFVCHCIWSFLYDCRPFIKLPAVVIQFIVSH